MSASKYNLLPEQLKNGWWRRYIGMSRVVYSFDGLQQARVIVGIIFLRKPNVFYVSDTGGIADIPDMIGPFKCFEEAAACWMIQKDNAELWSKP